METLLLNPAAVEEATQLPDVVSAVEDAFAAYATGDAQMPSKSYIDLPQHDGDFRSMPAYIESDEWDGAGIKWVNSHPSNPEDHGLPTVMGTMIYSDPETALPLAILDGTTLTRKRTGAAAAVASTVIRSLRRIATASRCLSRTDPGRSTSGMGQKTTLTPSPCIVWERKSEWRRK